MNNFEELQALSRAFIASKYETYQRYFIRTIPLKHRLVVILGERGVGKTTTIIQHLLATVAGDKLSDKILYVQADHFLVQGKTLYEIAETFVQFGGKVLAFDEIHKYPTWSMELKSIYDTFPKLHIIASGSSALAIHKGSHDLSRRAVVYHMTGLSLREYLELKYDLQLPVLTLEDVVQNHVKHAVNITSKLEKSSLKILKTFHEYLQYGYYPYFREFELMEEFKLTLEQNLHTTIEADLVAIYPQLTGNSIQKIKQLLAYIAQSVPFTPNWNKIKDIVDTSDNRTLKTYFKYLADAYIIRPLMADTDKLKRLEMPEKIFLGNASQLYTLAVQPNIGNVRETFFLSMLTQQHTVTATKNMDFCVDKKRYFEVGGKNKDATQTVGMSDAYLALDGIEQGAGKRIPLWLFGFLY
jgi:hypothetical protein